MPNTVSPLMTRQQVADHLGVPFKTLEQWAYHSKGPRFRKVGRHVRYLRSDVDAWFEQQAVGGAEVPAPRKPRGGK
jgi:excisionase family DNA binding protein